MKFYQNGLIVQDLDRKIDTRQDRSYSGIAAYMTEPLYLLKEKDEIAKQLSQNIFLLTNDHYRIDENGIEHYTLEVISKYDLSVQYIRHCQHLNLPFRLLFVESTFDDSIWEGPLFPMKFLGYEMGSSEIVDPTMIFEIANCVCPEFERFQSKINKNGLFDDYETINEYYNIRNKLLSEGEELENDNPYYIMKVSEVDSKDLQL
jgi:hypothetical protein